MFQRWKLILSNWINCYFIKSSKDADNLNEECLIKIISHLRENLNLDESKSSILEAHTVEEFLCEKYPDFKFDNEKVEASNDEEICLSASLLLFFVCVNSKNFDMKSAMCSKLSAEDQETILKFSKCLMECPVITIGEVQAAITEACEQDIAASEARSVAETPPALRSLHCHVRRLQAALDAERFDRNYLQEELARTNNKLERLLKEKEQHKLEILDLKAKISLCGDETASKHSESDVECGRLARALRLAEASLEQAQASLMQAQAERDDFKDEIEKQKTELDKWLSISQQESARVSQLTRELESERRQGLALKELVSELQHHRRNMDHSVECDDPDATISSIHNSSICSEVCANVVEVQLGEERAKIVVLQQQIQALQVQISELNQIREADKSTWKNIIAQRENDICSLKHRINEEIEKKNNLKTHCDNEKTKLNNEINELEQKLKEKHENSKVVIEKKMEEIQTLQEEKLSLIHSLSNETTKFENVIKELQSEIDKEKQARSKMRESYENHIMKLNEKVLNRNNELVELQNSVFNKGEQIEKLQIIIKNEKEEYGKLITQYESLNEHTNIVQIEFKKERDAFKELLTKQQAVIDEKNTLETEMAKTNEALKQLEEEFEKLNKNKLVIEQDLTKEREEHKALALQYEQIKEENNAIQTDLKKVKEAGKKLQIKYHTLHEHHKESKHEIAKEKDSFNDLSNKHQDLVKENEMLQSELTKCQETLKDLEQKYEDVTLQNSVIKNELTIAKDMVNKYENKCLHLEKENKTIQTDHKKVNLAFEQLTNKYQEIVEQNNSLQIELQQDREAFKALLGKFEKLEAENNSIQNELIAEKEATELFTNKYRESVEQSTNFEIELAKQKETFEELLRDYRNLDEHRNSIENDLRLKCEEETSLKVDLETKVLSLEDKLTESEELAEKLKNSYDDQIESLNVMVTKLSNYLKEKTVELESLKKDKDMIQQTAEENCKVIKSLQDELQTEKHNVEMFQSDFEAERQVLKNMVTVTESVMEDTKLSLSNEISEHMKARNILEQDRSKLQSIKQDMEIKFKNVETANASLLSLLRIERSVKNDVEIESEYIMENLDHIIKCLVEERKSNATMVQDLKSQNELLTESSDKLMKDINLLKETNNDLEKKISSTEEKIGEIHKEKLELEAKHHDSGNKILTLRHEVMKLEEKVADVTDENNNLKTKDYVNVAKIEELGSTITALETEIQAQKQTLKLVEEEKTKALLELQNISNQLASMTEIKSQLEISLQDKTQKFEETLLQMDEMKIKIDTLTSENSTFKTKDSESFATLEELKNTITALKIELQTQGEKLKLAGEEKTKSLLELQNISNRLSSTIETKSQLEISLQDKLQKCDETQLQMDEMKIKIDILTDENNNLKTKHSESFAQIEDLKSTITVLETEIQNLEQKFELLGEEKTKASLVLQDISNQLANMTENKSQLEISLKDKTRQFDEAQLQINESKIEIDKLTDENNNLKIKDIESIAKIEELKSSITVLETELKTQEQKIELIGEEKTKALLELQNISDHLSSTLKDKSELEISLQDKIQKLDEAQLKIDDLNMKIEVLTDENNNFKLEETESVAKITEMKENMNALEDEFRVKLETILQEKSLLNSDVQTITNQLTMTRNEKNQLEATLIELTQNLDIVQSKNEEFENKFAELHDENNNLKLENHNTIAELEEMTRTKDELVKQLEFVKRLSDNLKMTVETVENELQVQTNKMMKSLEEATQNFVAVQNENSILKKEKEQISCEIEEYKAKAEDLKVALINNEEFKKNINILENKLQANEDTLKAMLEEKCKVENELQNHVAQLAEAVNKRAHLEITLENTTQNLTVLQHEIEELKHEFTNILVDKNNLEASKNECVAKIKDLEEVQLANQELKAAVNNLEVELKTQEDKLQTLLHEKSEIENILHSHTINFEKISDEKSQMEKALEEKTVQEMSHSDMITKLTNYLKDKTLELEVLRKDKEILQQTVGDSCKVIKTLEENLKLEKQTVDKITGDFESERQMLKNMVSATESVMEDTKLGLSNEISRHLIAKDCLEVEKKDLQNSLRDSEMKQYVLEMANNSLLSLLKIERNAKQEVEEESELVREYLDEIIGYLCKERNSNISVISALEFQEKALIGDYEKIKSDLGTLQTTNRDLKLAVKDLENELRAREDNAQKVLDEKSKLENELKMHAEQLAKVLEAKSQIEEVLNEKMQNLVVVQLEIKELKSKMAILFNEKNNLEFEKKESCAKIEEEKEEILKLKSDNRQLLTTIEENRNVITNLEQLIKHELEQNHKLRDGNEQEKLIMTNRLYILQEYQTKAEKLLEERQTEIKTLQKELQTLQARVELSEQDSKAKDGLISKMSKEKDAVISTISKELLEEKALREKLEKEIQAQKTIVSELRNDMEIRALKKENEQLIRAIGQQETLTALSQEKAAEKYACHQEPRDSHQVDSSSSDNMHSSVESLKTITDLEKIIHDKNRTITTLQTDITYLKTLMAESETKLLDVSKELEISKDNAQQLSNQLKKLVSQKNEEIADLRKQVTRMSATENRASRIIKVSAKYQAMIVKRVAEIKSNTVLKELTNFGNSDNEVRRSLAGNVTMEDLENFLETTDKHLKRCSEKQILLQKERDRLIEVNRIHESELNNLKKFLTELSVSFQTFSSVKDLYGHKLSRVISVQRTVRREILNLDGRISDGAMCKLERGYGAVMQDLAECTMNLERWVERCISRTVSVEKIKQAFTSDSDRSSLSSPSFQNTGLEIQLEELEKSFQKLLEEIARAVKNEAVTETQAATVMEVRAEYEDKLNRMKAKMKELFNEQMTLLKNKQREEIELLERELQKTRSRMEDLKRAYESHIKDLTKELWSVGEKYLVKNDEAEWLRRKQRSGSLMSLQHVHSSGLVPLQESASRPSDAHSLRSLPSADQQAKGKRDGRGLHMSDEEGEVFDNRCLKELAMTPRREPPGQRLSELKWRNSLCPPHLKSSYPAETQFAPTLDEDDLKAGASAAGARARKEVGITAYKKPGPPTPSKQAGRLSATDSELRESVRVETDPQNHTERKTSTPARFRAFLRLNKHDSNEGTPRTRRLSSIFRKK